MVAVAAVAAAVVAAVALPVAVERTKIPTGTTRTCFAGLPHDGPVRTICRNSRCPRERSDEAVGNCKRARTGK